MKKAFYLGRVGTIALRPITISLLLLVLLVVNFFLVIDADNTRKVFLATLPILPLLLISTIIWGIARYWRGKGLDEVQLQARRSRIKEIRTIALAFIFLTLFIFARNIVPVKTYSPDVEPYLILLCAFIFAGSG